MSWSKFKFLPKQKNPVKLRLKVRTPQHQCTNSCFSMTTKPVVNWYNPKNILFYDTWHRTKIRMRRNNTCADNALPNWIPWIHRNRDQYGVMINIRQSLRIYLFIFININIAVNNGNSPRYFLTENWRIARCQCVIVFHICDYI